MRKLRLFACACCRRVEHLTSFPEFVHVIKVAEQYADGTATAAELRASKQTAEWTFQSQNAPGIHYRRADRAVVELSEEWWGGYFHPVESTRRVGSYARRAAEHDWTRREFLPEPAFATYPPTHNELMDHIRRCEERDAAEEAEDIRFNAIEATH